MEIKKLYTVKEVAQILHVNVNYVHKLRKAGLITFMKLGSLKCRNEELERFLRDNEGYDLTDPFNVTELRV
jgi:excisionase family DNA binding protein